MGGSAIHQHRESQIARTETCSRPTFIAMNAPKTPSGNRRFCGDGSEGTGPSWRVGVAEAAVLANNSAGDDPEVVEDAAASTSEAPIALNENPKVGGSGWRLRYMSTSNIGNTRSVSSGQTREVHSQLLEFLLFVAGRVAVLVSFVVGAPLGRRITTFSFALPFAPFGTLCLPDARAVGLVVPIASHR